MSNKKTNNMANKTFTPNPAIITPLVEMFKVCPIGSSKLGSKKLTANAMLKGYLVDPKCMKKYANAFIDNIDMQYNSTFYKTWNDVTNKSRFELLVDQILHYMTTYGTDFQLGSGYIPNTTAEEPGWHEYKVIEGCTWEELYNMCIDIICSGIALKSNTVKYVTDYIIEYYRFVNTMNNVSTSIDVDAIKNREAMIILCDKLELLPKTGQKLLSYIVYKTTGETMIIKNRTMRELIHYYASKAEPYFNSLDNNQLIALSEVFNRYKPIFMAFKNYKTNSVINKISHLSKKHHKPMNIGFWERVLNMQPEEFELNCNAYLDKATNFKLIQVMQAIRERLLVAAEDGSNMYIIRNGKIFVKDSADYKNATKLTHLGNVYNACYKQLIENLKGKACAVKLPTNYELTCPTSEKNFIGDFPMGTSCKLGKESVVGIYWKNNWGAHDFDISYTDVCGNRISWCSDYYKADNSVIYSGDITNAPNGANEVLKFTSDNITNGIVNVNRYNGFPGAKYKLFFGTDDKTSFTNKNDMYNYMVDPNNVKLEAEIYQNESSQQSIGIVLDGKFYFYSLSCGYDKVARALNIKNNKNNNNIYKSATASADELITILNRKTMSLLSLNEVLAAAGFWEATDEDTTVLDLTTINRSDLINLFTK